MADSNKAREILCDLLNVAASELNDDSGIQTLPQWDSLAHLRIISHLESLLGNKLELDDMLEIVDLRSLSRFVERNL